MTRNARFALVAALALAIAPPVEAGHRRRPCVPVPRCWAPAAYPAYPGVPARPIALAARQGPSPAWGPPGVATAAPPPAALAWLNGQRTARGLRPLAWDPALAADAARNSAMGLGHWTRNFGRGQVVGWGPLAAVEALWISDGPHYRILMDPRLTSAGFGAAGNVATIDVR